jgi:16S rRNA C967 or C1407 C5-methylase (RsmB/RsmF family)
MCHPVNYSLYSSVKAKPRFLRVNTLKATIESVIEELNKEHMVLCPSFLASLLI